MAADRVNVELRKAGTNPEIPDMGKNILSFI